jgi:2-oxoglutarate dehydrogenase E2 component (dihydrolipoamide succinyltransferase)
MLVDIKVPTPGESISQVLFSRKLVENGAIVAKDTEIAEIDSDKATLTITTEQSGKIKFLIEEGDTILVQSVIAQIDTDFQVESHDETNLKEVHTNENNSKGIENKQVDAEIVSITPLAQNMMNQEHISADEVEQFLKNRKITKELVDLYMNNRGSIQPKSEKKSRTQERVKMTPLRQKLAERLVSVKNETAMLTTFNEIDMSFVMELKRKYSDLFKQKHGVSLGYMSLFTKAASIALQQFPAVNSQIDGEEIVSFDFTDIAIAVSAPKGLLVPVVRNVEQLSVPEIEISIKEFAARARESKLTLDEMQGGTFTITNGGVFGSLMSTPIINPPQSAILGMHNIVDRPIALNGQVVIRPMMYVALSYDHRIIDGRESVSFLKLIKEHIENPVSLLTSGKNPIETLLEL